LSYRAESILQLGGARQVVREEKSVEVHPHGAARDSGWSKAVNHLGPADPREASSREEEGGPE
jgi:hypothetical protein